MDQYSVQSVNNQDITPPDGVIPEKSSPVVKKFIPLLLLCIFILILLSGLMVLSANKTSNNTQTVLPTPTIRPTATPFSARTTLSATAAPVSSVSAIPKIRIGRLAFIRKRDIYHSDLGDSWLLVKNATRSADKLVWSPQGNFLSWRQRLEASSSALAVYNRGNGYIFQIKPGTISSEIIDYAWAQDEKKVAVLYHDDKYRISSFYIVSPTSGKKIIESETVLKQIFWPGENTLLYLGNDGIANYNFSNSSTGFIANDKNILKMRLRPDGQKILYIVSEGGKNNLYLINPDGSSKQQIPAVLEKPDMGTTNLPSSILEGGFIPEAIFFPDGERILVGYNYMPDYPLAGVYDLSKWTFTALAPFPLSPGDRMVDNLRLMGTRVSTIGNKTASQISIFSIEEGARLGLAKVIPDASDPAFFGNDLLPSGNFF